MPKSQSWYKTIVNKNVMSVKMVRFVKMFGQYRHQWKFCDILVTFVCPNCKLIS